MICGCRYSIRHLAARGAPLQGGDRIKICIADLIHHCIGRVHLAAGGGLRKRGLTCFGVTTH